VIELDKKLAFIVGVSYCSSFINVSGVIVLKLIERNWQLIFLVFAILFTALSHFRPFPFSWLIKIMPLILLLNHLIRSQSDRYPVLLKYGIIFSLLGDFILDYYSGKGFIFGLAAFFVAHIFYILSLAPWKSQTRTIPIAIAALIYGITVIRLISPNLGQLAIPVYAYMTILFAMTLAALFSRRSNVWLSIGAISFLLSDSLIGITLFYETIDYSDLYIMGSYYLAQYGLIKGFGASPQAYLIKSVAQENQI